MTRATHPLGTRARRRRPALAAAVYAALAFVSACDPPRIGPDPGGTRTPGLEPPPSDDPGAPAPLPAPAPSKAAPSPEPPKTSAGPARAAPLEGPGPLVDLPVEGYSAAVVSLPLGATGLRPVVLATHGNFDRPEWQCDVWRKIVGGNVFILCPRGVARPDSPGPDDVRFHYRSNQALEKEIRAGLDALRARFPEHVDPGLVVYTGFSQGAIMGVSITSRDPESYPRVVLVEGGHDKWTAGTVRAFAAPGGNRRVLFACGQPGCVAAAKRPAALLEKAGVAVKIVHGKGMGHSYDGAVMEETRGAFDWVTEGDPRFAR